MAFYNNGEVKTRPGVYMRITNRVNSIFAPATTDPVDPGGSGDVENVGTLLSSDGYVLRDSNGLYIKSKEVA